MKPRRKRTLFWILGIIITLAAAFYQRITGPTYPKKTEININGKSFDEKLIRTHEGTENAQVLLKLHEENISAQLYYKSYPEIEGEDYTSVEFTKGIKKHKFLFWEFETKGLIAELPNQPPAGKLMYYIKINDTTTTQEIYKDDPVIIRFKGAVPKFVLIPHVIFMFLAMFLANVSGLFAAFKIPQFKRYTTITLLLMLLGGMILGPIVQKYAFLEFWAGVPKGWDLTDNKLLIAFLAWLAAFLLNRKKENRTSVIIASLITIIIFSIPHSMYGSELNRETGEITQGFIRMFLMR